jgi:hypothetical protein
MSDPHDLAELIGVPGVLVKLFVANATITTIRITITEVALNSMRKRTRRCADIIA